MHWTFDPVFYFGQTKQVPNANKQINNINRTEMYTF